MGIIRRVDSQKMQLLCHPCHRIKVQSSTMLIQLNAGITKTRIITNYPLPKLVPPTANPPLPPPSALQAVPLAQSTPTLSPSPPMPLLPPGVYSIYTLRAGGTASSLFLYLCSSVTVFDATQVLELRFLIQSSLQA